MGGKINELEFSDKDLQCYVQTKDGRTYTALARIPEGIGNRFQLLNSMSGVIGWLFAKTSGETKNGYQMTGNNLLYFIISTEQKFTFRIMVNFYLNELLNFEKQIKLFHLRKRK